MELLFIGVACTDDAIEESNRKYYNNVSQVRPQQHFDLQLTSGLSKQCNVKAVSLPPVAAFPRSKCLFYYRKKDVLSNTLRIHYISLINLPFIKTFITVLYVFISTLFFCIKNIKKERSILMGSILFYTAIPAMLIAKIFRVKVFVSVPDLPQYTISYTKMQNRVRYIFTKISLIFDKFVERGFDGYILLTEQMNELVNFKKKPYIIMEGMLQVDETYNNIEKEDSTKVVMYAGTLHEKFGVKKLVDAFKLCNSSDCELWIFGVGDYLEKLQKDILEYNNIKYKGSASRSQIIKFEHRATLLVNPRPSNEDFTKYSFPSKTIEYMASGTPLLTTKLPGIPKEYFDYVFLFNSEEVEGMAKDIDYILSLSDITLNDFGVKAQKFIVNNKNNNIQAKKIYDFLHKYNNK